MINFNPITHKSVGELVYDELKFQLLTGKYTAGDHLIETDVAMEFGVSRTPVREAIQRLAQEGLLRIEARRGTFVREFDAAKMLKDFRLLNATSGYIREEVPVFNKKDIDAKFKGVIAPNLTIFTPDGEVDVELCKKHLNWLIKNGVSGFIAADACGSGCIMRPDQRVQIYRLAKEVTEKHRGAFAIANVSAPDLETSLLLAKEAALLGMDAICVYPPKDFEYSEAELKLYYDALVRNVGGLPLFVLGKTPAGVNAFAFGADAQISGMANYAPDIVSEVYRISKEGDTARARKATTLAKKLDAKCDLGAAPKSAQVAYRARGFEAGHMRSPFIADYENLEDHMRAVAAAVEETKNLLQSV